MTKPKKIGIVLLTAGAVLVIAALLLFSHNRAEDRRAGESAEDTLRLVEAAMAERETNGETGTTPAPGASASPGAAAAGTEIGSGGLPAPPALDMPTVRSGAYDYIGYLDFPGYDLTMPVAATWSFPAMEISPCRHTGSVYNDNLVVAGHNYKTEFDVLFHLEAGDTVTFTDVDGNVFTYTVREFASVTPDDSDTVMNSGYALTMYTCNWDTSERVTVFCERTGGEIPGDNA